MFSGRTKSISLWIANRCKQTISIRFKARNNAQWRYSCRGQYEVLGLAKKMNAKTWMKPANNAWMFEFKCEVLLLHPSLYLRYPLLAAKRPFPFHEPHWFMIWGWPFCYTQQQWKRKDFFLPAVKGSYNQLFPCLSMHMHKSLLPAVLIQKA